MSAVNQRDLAMAFAITHLMDVRHPLPDGLIEWRDAFLGRAAAAMSFDEIEAVPNAKIAFEVLNISMGDLLDWWESKRGEAKR